MHLSGIYIYPIKSLSGISLTEAILEEKGIRYDRRWMLVDESGMFLSQRTFPKMALLQVSLNSDGLVVTDKNNSEINISIPFEPKSTLRKSVTIWEDTIEAQLVDENISKWFSEQLEMPCDLVIMPDSTQRKLKEKYAVNGESVSFADGMPYLLIGQSSLIDLNAKLENPVPMDRFRPNFVFEGGEEFIEDTWEEIQIGDALFKITKPCARCVMTTINQDDASKSKEPLRTLATYRTVDGKVMFGQNMLLLKGVKVKIGDSLKTIKLK
ncbi:putative Fe-S protein [Belliella baltica DSM 15883]|uniref:Putative Fe-S protein n=1 Tax=Belliella baltica (strain DSM 15883 / CIP 108006 / LMG 21964 / BA134) TaxID=866536 RepID=I3Z0X8_BELBD|nr:MOSC N-terminal beta barrel domain-containing protein [Belliella baltica]AFL82896.1 putative Fe-S protein [Belliella baltica DSM 15883]